ncbi:MAG: extracellular solute-binding protein [Clostridia bacterium]|nr:extracellular solute-binding protein [Clostridia bacterium]
MKKLTLILSVCLLFSFVVSSAQASQLLCYGLLVEDCEGYRNFVQNHSDVSVQRCTQWYATTSTFANALKLGELSCDLFSLNTLSYNWSSLIEKGYCVDLSESKIIADTMEKIYPNIAALGMKDGHIYAVPVSISFRNTLLNQDALAMCGWEDEPTPQSFPELLDFADRWCDLIEENGAYEDLRLRAGWDPDLYGEGTYSAWLISLLIDSYISQTQYADETLDFNNQELIGLLERCMTVGRRLYALEPKPRNTDSGVGIGFLETAPQLLWPTNADQIVCFRLNDQQPAVLKAVVNMQAVYSGSGQTELAVQFLESLLAGEENPANFQRQLLYTNAEPKISNNYEYTIATDKKYIAETEAQLQNSKLSTDERIALEDELAKWKQELIDDESDERKYLVSAAKLASYREKEPYFYFETPNAFNSSTEASSQLKSLEEQYANGVINVETLVKELNRIARMSMLEDE